MGRRYEGNHPVKTTRSGAHCACHQLLRRAEWDYPALLEAIAGFTAQQAAWRPALTSNSIWQIVDHLAASKEWQIEMLQKGQAEARAWIQSSGEEEAWQALITHRKDAHRRFVAERSQLEDEQLLAYPVHGLQRTLLERILSAGSAHEAHHVGQISYLRGLLDYHHLPILDETGSERQNESKD